MSNDFYPLSVVLIEPDIPQNTGNIARLCVATGTRLVLVRPLGFRLTDKALERAGMDYWKQLNPLILDDLDEFFEWSRDKRLFFLSSKATKNYAQVNYRHADVLVFGSESSGFPRQVIDYATTKDALITLPMREGIRCLNVSSAAAAAVFESLRQIHNWSSVLPVD